MNQWKLHVEGLGKIEEADIEISPFTMFVGENNSGKSYLMTLIWGIRRNLLCDYGIFEKSEEGLERIYRLNSYKKCTPILEKLVDESITEEDTFLSDEEIASVIELYNDLLEVYKNKLCEQLFFSKNVCAKKITVQMISVKEHGFGKWHSKDELEKFIENSFWKNSNKLRREWKELIINLFILKLICDSLFHGKQVNKQNPIDAFFPTSRTGIVLNFQMLVDYLIRPAFREYENHDQHENYTLPIVELITSINWITADWINEDYKDIISFIESNVITGKVGLAKQYSKQFLYISSDGKAEELPMKLCSGVVTEVVLMVMFLKHLGLSSITIEEPEMCLHPRLQWQYARAFIKMHNTGLPVLMATHSDIFIAQVNNMIKLNSNVEREQLMEQYGYEKDDLISHENIKVYHFDVQNNGYTKVTEIEADEDGFRIPSFQKAIGELLQQSMEFETEEA